MENKGDGLQKRMTFITGGARSGKSMYAQHLALQWSASPVYVATARQYPDDAEFSERIRHHQQDRDERWTSIEEPLYVSRLDLQQKVVVIDCVTLWLTNFFSLHGYDTNLSLDTFRKEIDNLGKITANLMIISNEIGMGVHAETAIGRKFTDLQGWANQYLANMADEVILMISGIPLNLPKK